MAETQWMRPYAGFHYTTMIGFDTYVRSSYAGMNAVVGVQFGRF